MVEAVASPDWRAGLEEAFMGDRLPPDWVLALCDSIAFDQKKSREKPGLSESCYRCSAQALSTNNVYQLYRPQGQPYGTASYGCLR